MKKTTLYSYILLIFLASAVRAAESIPAILPESSAAWNTTQTYEYPLPSSGSWEENTNTGMVVKVCGVWHIIYNSNNDVDDTCFGTVGRKLGVATSPTGLGNWTKATGNPVIEYVGRVRGCDYGIVCAALGRNPDGSLAKLDGKWVLIFGNYDGIDSTLGWPLLLMALHGKKWEKLALQRVRWVLEI